MGQGSGLSMVTCKNSTGKMLLVSGSKYDGQESWECVRLSVSEMYYSVWAVYFISQRRPSALDLSDGYLLAAPTLPMLAQASCLHVCLCFYGKELSPIIWVGPLISSMHPNPYILKLGGRDPYRWNSHHTDKIPDGSNLSEVRLVLIHSSECIHHGSQNLWVLVMSYGKN